MPAGRAGRGDAFPGCRQRRARVRAGDGVRLVLLAATLSATLSSACALLWAGSEISQGQPPLQENVRTETVPLPGLTEEVKLRVFLAGRPPPPEPTDPNASINKDPPPRPPPVRRLEIDCEVTQSGRETEYLSATRYGTHWKIASGLAFIAEGLAAAVLFRAAFDHPPDAFWGSVYAVDGLATGVLFFMPKYDAYEQRVRPRTTTVGSRCPDGLALSIDGRVALVSPGGRLDDVGEALYEAHMNEPFPPAPLGVALGASQIAVPIDPIRHCGWARLTRPVAQGVLPACADGRYYPDPAPIDTTLAVPVGAASGRAR